AWSGHSATPNSVASLKKQSATRAVFLKSVCNKYSQILRMWKHFQHTIFDQLRMSGSLELHRFVLYCRTTNNLLQSHKCIYLNICTRNVTVQSTRELQLQHRGKCFSDLRRHGNPSIPATPIHC
ncbi:hypothetical protein PO909_005603, partial [Leuciscus waleckii]